MQERRRITRTRVLKGAMFFVDKSSVTGCVVRDITNAGAGVEVPHSIDLPETLDLTLNNGRTFRRCRLVWRNQNMVGVEFN
jgi:hypothetical protein